MDDFDVDIPEVHSENDFTIFYKGKQEQNGKIVEPIEEIKISKNDFFRKLRYFKRKAYEFAQLNEIFIHDTYPIEIFKRFINVIKTNKISLNDSNYSDLYQLSLKYEYHELQQEIQKFSQNRPDLKKIVDTYSFDEFDTIKEDKIAEHLDICLKNENMVNFPLSILNRILNSPKRIINDHHLLFQFVKKVINKHTSANNNDNDNNSDNFQALLSSLDYCQMSNEELDEFLSDKRFSEVFDARNSKKKMKAFYEESKLSQERLKSLEVQMETFRSQLSNDFQNYINNLESKARKSETKINEMEVKIANQERIIEQNKNENQDLKTIIHNQDLKLKELEKKVQKLEIDAISFITGTITANVDSNQVIKGTINLVEKNVTLDKANSKYILNTSSSQTLGKNSYEHGSPIQNLSQEFSFSKSSGTYYVHALVVDNRGKEFEIVSEPIRTNGVSPMNFGYTGTVQSVTLEPGAYKLEVWGAEGGKNISGNRINTAGKGGYSFGVLSLQSRTKLFVHVGQSSSNQTGGWNGGGSAKNSNAAGGGGATDISLYGSDGGSDWNNTNHLYSRIIVAGGGGGSANSSYSQYYGGCGGGTSGQSPGGSSNNEGTQTRAGMNLATDLSSGQGFGKGGDHIKCCSSGGGGGWYGGAASNNECYSGGAGGSGYVYSASTASVYPSNCKLTSLFYLANASTIAGNMSFPNPHGAGNESGHSGDGYARITPQ